MSNPERCRNCGEPITYTDGIGRWIHVDGDTHCHGGKSQNWAAPERRKQHDSQPVAAPSDPETAWLIEDGSTPPKYATVPEWAGIAFDEDINKALRLSRRADAEMLCILLDDGPWKIREHMWPKPVAARSRRATGCATQSIRSRR